jgi:hypothetical protein
VAKPQSTTSILTYFHLQNSTSTAIRYDLTTPQQNPHNPCKMAPSAIDTPMQDFEPENNVPPPQLYPPREAHFEKFIEPRPDGYQKAKSRGNDRAAIVIDNGNLTPSLRRHPEHIC